MTRSTMIGGASGIVILLVLLVLPTSDVTQEQDGEPVAAPPAIAPSTEMASEANQGFLYGRVNTSGGAIYQGRLRWGGTQEAFWGDYFNGSKAENPWTAYLPHGNQEESRPFKIFGIEIAGRGTEMNLSRQFMARFGDISRIEANGRDLRVTLKSGTVFHLDRFGADDLADGLRVWDSRGGFADLDEWKIRTIEFLPTARIEPGGSRLYGTVRTRHTEYTGFIQWNREDCLGSDKLDGRTVEGELSLRFDTIRSIERHSDDSCTVTLLDGRPIMLSGTREVGPGNRGIYVDDMRFGRVLVSWDAFERVDFTPGGGGPAYDYFPPGLPLTGSVTISNRRRLTGRLVYDLDESETTETLDAPLQGVNYNIPFGLVASILLPGSQRARLTLHNGEELQLERAGDLGEMNAGMLVFIDGREPPEYLPWADIEQITFDRPAAMYPQLDKH